MKHSDTRTESDKFKRSFVAALVFTAILWIVKLLEISLHLNLYQWGVFPQTTNGLIGILTAPLIHGSFAHLGANTPAVVVLGTALFYVYPRSAKIVLPSVYLLSGLGVWIWAREVYHYGASGLTFGVMFFIFTLGVLRWDRRAIALSMMVFFLYGSMLVGLVPQNNGVSYETHFFGAMVGVLLAFVLRHLDPPMPTKKYSWEDEEEDDPDPDPRL